MEEDKINGKDKKDEGYKHYINVHYGISVDYAGEFCLWGRGKN